MSRNKSLWNLGAALLVIVMVLLALGTGAWAQTTYKTLHRFTGKDGSGLVAPLTIEAGSLYSTTTSGGSFGEGTVFKLTPNADGSWTRKVIHNFTGGKDGANPEGAALIFDQTGNLYGTTAFGGASGNGVVFRLTPNADGKWTEKVLHHFTGTGKDGGFPVAGLIFDTAGNLYGTAGLGAHGNGVVFKLTPKADGSWSESVLYSFCPLSNCSDGGAPSASLIFDQTGNLYGTTAAGGNSNVGGVAFKLTPNQDGTWSESVLYTFCSLSSCNDGANPHSNLIFDNVGNLYGTAPGGPGVVFMLSPSQGGGWSESVLYSFCPPCRANGATPYGGLLFDGAGNLYGTTQGGGSGTFPYGVVYKLAPNSKGAWNETVLHSFDDHPGAYPFAAVIFDAAGKNLYGTTKGDGNRTFGSVFRITP
jgi:uncharacterized repeat protein (TIGR03803 family)